MKHFTLLSLIALLSYWANAQTPQLLGDIQKPTPINFKNLDGPFHTINGKVIFYGSDSSTLVSGFWAYNGERVELITNWGYGHCEPAVTENGFYLLEPGGVNDYYLWKHGGNPGVSFYIDLDVKHHSQFSFPSIAYLNGKVFYPQWTVSTGYELWCARDSLGSGYLVKDCKPGNTSNFPTELSKADSLVYFRGGGTVARELWRSDGTEAGTFMLFQTASPDYYIQDKSLKTIGNIAYFLVKNNTEEVELWSSDGTITGTTQSADLPPNTTSETYFEAFIFNGKYIYLANDQQNLNLEWIATDGTPNGTEILLDFPVGADYHFMLYSLSANSILNGSFFFMYHNPDNDSELWKSNGTAIGTTKIKTIDAGSGKLLCSTKQDFFFLIEKSPNDAVYLWASDGTATGTREIKYLGSEGDIYGHSGSAALDSSILFSSPFYGSNVAEFPIRSDGTTQGTFPVQGALAPLLAGSNPVGFVSGPEEAVFFHADSENYFRGVWRTEPSAPFSITRLDTTSQDLYLEVGTPMTVGDKVLWFSNDHTLHVTDASGIIDEIQLPVNFSYFWDYGPDGLVYFVARNSKSIWRTDGTPGGTFEVFAASGNSLLYDLKTAGDSLYFMERFSVPNQPNIHLWSSDGTASGTQVIETVTNSHPIFLQSVENRLVYATYSVNPNASTLYARGFEPVYFPDLYSDDFIGLSITDSQLFVLGRPEYSPTDSFHYSLWTAENAQPNLLREFKAIMGHEYYDLKPQNHLHRLGNSVLMGAGLTENNTELWISDGTSGGTKEVLDLKILRAVPTLTILCATTTNFGFLPPTTARKYPGGQQMAQGRAHSKLRPLQQ